MKKINIKTILLILALLLVWRYHGGCIQTKNYKVELTEEQKAEIVDAVTHKMAEEQQESK